MVTNEGVYFHCAKAIQRSKLWDASRHVDRRTLPSVNAMLAAIQWERCRKIIGLGRATDSKPIAADDGSAASSAELPQ